MKSPRIGSLCSGYGGLDESVREIFGGSIAWFFEYDKAPSKILAHHWPDVPNYGDMTKADWAAIEQVDILCGGTPCQDLSGAGKRAGMTEGTRSNLWVQMREAIAIQRPSIVVWENVRGAYSAGADSEVERTEGLLGGAPGGSLRALGRVLGDLSSLGYDAEWCGVRAADAGAPHGRYRVFILAYAQSERRNDGHTLDKRAPSGRLNVPEYAGDVVGGPSGTQATADTPHNGHERARASRVGRDGSADGGEPIANPGSQRGPRSGATEWGDYLPAIRRWETVTGRIAPAPTNGDGKNGSHRLSARFVEWMMGLDEGHVTNPAIGLTRNEQLKALGNGVVPQQAALALRVLLERRTA